mmetsp:Transcript_25069/g.62704  ORF Transcript_25069/g.62704 Transcript_25069/m.62704 type:complete len:81 (-) Transcript_25069:127-369(-)
MINLGEGNAYGDALKKWDPPLVDSLAHLLSCGSLAMKIVNCRGCHRIKTVFWENPGLSSRQLALKSSGGRKDKTIFRSAG